LRGLASELKIENRMASRNPHRLEQNVLTEARQDFARILVHQTVGEALAQVQESQPGGQVVYFYVVDEQDRLQGVVPARGLLLNPAHTPVAEIMIRKVATVPADATLLDACEMFILHRLLALPVVDRQGRLRGVVDVSLYTDEMIDVADRQAGDDLFQLIGVRLHEVRRASLPTVFRYRFPWLLCNLGSGLMCAFIAGWFQSVLERVLMLAFFVPVTLALAEAVSIQSLTLALQAQHGNQIGWRRLLAAASRELPMGMLLGVTTGTLVGLVAWLWRADSAIAGCMMASIALAVTTAAMCGLLAPAILATARRDTRVASGPIALAMADVATLVYFFGLASWWLTK
jgi:magnesium transporter